MIKNWEKRSESQNSKHRPREIQREEIWISYYNDDGDDYYNHVRKYMRIDR